MARPTTLDYQKYTKELMEDLYIKQNLSRQGVCDKLGLPESQVRSILKHWGIRKSLTMQLECKMKGIEMKKATGWYREATARSWQNPEIREKRLAGLQASMTDEWRRKVSEGQKGKKQPESQKQAMREYWANGKWDFFRSEEYWDEKREEYSERSKKQWAELSEEERDVRCKRFIKVAREHRAKALETMRERKRFGKSTWEDRYYRQLGKIFDDVQRQYKSDEYPYKCDFYIPKLKLYIELQCTWTHGGRPYLGDEEDKKQLNDWKERTQTSDYYAGAIKTWTERDVKKRTIAKENNLNYKELWTREEAKAYLEELKRSLL